MSLPTCAVHSPSCGACGGETSHDGDSFYCEDCHLDYGDGDDGNEATFRDEDDAPCGKPCDNTWHGDHKIKPGWTYDCNPCALPSTHKDDCWTNCQPREMEATDD